MLNRLRPQSIIHSLRTRHLARLSGMQVVVMSALIVALVGGTLGFTLSSAQAGTNCAKGDIANKVKSNDTLSQIAEDHHISWHTLAEYNQLANPDMIYSGQIICIPTKDSRTASTSTNQDSTSETKKSDQQDDKSKADKSKDNETKKKDQKPKPKKKSKPKKRQPSSKTGPYNSYPYGQCTYWADERFHQLHKVYVPWLYNSDAWKWSTRARENGWHVSSKPTKGSIMVLQPWVQGAHGYGHVAIVEKVLPNGRVLTSNMNWGGSGSRVVHVQFHTGKGVSFITR